jgi:hypothetical protein
MYVLSENLEKVGRRKRRIKRLGRKPGMIRARCPPVCRLDLIQPLNIRANQGDCVRITLRNKLDGEDVSLHIHGSSTIVKATGRGATSPIPTPRSSGAKTSVGGASGR